MPLLLPAETGGAAEADNPWDTGSVASNALLLLAIGSLLVGCPAPTPMPTAEATSGSGSEPAESVAEDPEREGAPEPDEPPGPPPAERRPPDCVDQARTHAALDCRAGRIEVFEPIAFEIDDERLERSSEAALQDIAELLLETPYSLQVRVHLAQDPGPRARMLSRDRAQAVRTALMERGLEALRVEAEGYEGERPLVDPRGSSQRLRWRINQRVELLLVRGGEVDASAPWCSEIRAEGYAVRCHERRVTGAPRRVRAVLDDLLALMPEIRLQVPGRHRNSARRHPDRVQVCTGLEDVVIVAPDEPFSSCSADQ